MVYSQDHCQSVVTDIYRHFGYFYTSIYHTIVSLPYLLLYSLSEDLQGRKTFLLI